MPPPPPRPRRVISIFRQTLFPFSLGLHYPGPIGPLPYSPSPWRRPLRRRQLPVIEAREHIDSRSALELDRLSAVLGELVERPRTRADCAQQPRPCPFVSCRHHLFLDVHPRSGSIRLNFPGKDVDEIGDTCALDVADRGGLPLREVAARMNLTFQRVKQIEADGLKHSTSGVARLRVDLDE